MPLIRLSAALLAGALSLARARGLVDDPIVGDGPPLYLDGDDWVASATTSVATGCSFKDGLDYNTGVDG